MIRATPAIPDGALPSAQAVLLDVSLKWAERTGDEDLKTRVQAELDAVRPLAAAEPFRYALLIELMVRSPAKAPPAAVEPAGLR